MGISKRVDSSGAADAAAQDPQARTSTFLVEGVVLEVLAGFGLAHLRAADGATYGLNHQTPGIHFADLRKGQRICAEVTPKFGRVVHARLLEESNAQSVRGSNEEGGAGR